MKEFKMEGVTIVSDVEISEEEANEYLKILRGKYPRMVLAELHSDGEYFDAKVTDEPKPFQRLRRITGYLVGTVERWNNGKKAELRDRVKHAMEENKNE